MPEESKRLLFYFRNKSCDIVPVGKKEGRKKKYLSAWCRYKLVGKFQILRVNFSNISRNFKYISNRNSRLFLKLGNVSGIQYTPGLENKKNLHHIIKLRSGRI